MKRTPDSDNIAGMVLNHQGVTQFGCMIAKVCVAHALDICLLKKCIMYDTSYYYFKAYIIYY